MHCALRHPARITLLLLLIVTDRTQAQQNPKIMKMLEAEMKLSGLIEEVNRVLMKPVQQLYESI